LISNDPQISRRAFLSAAALACAGCGMRPSGGPALPGMPPGAEEDPQLAREFAGALLAVSETGLIRLVTHHPSGATDLAPQRPLAVIVYWHSGHSGGLTEAQTPVLCDTLEALFRLQERGVRRFNFEGIDHDPAEQNFRPRLGFERLGNRISGALADLRHYADGRPKDYLLKHRDTMKGYLERVDGQLGLLFAECMLGAQEVACSGSEDPRTFAKFEALYKSVVVTAEREAAEPYRKLRRAYVPGQEVCPTTLDGKPAAGVGGVVLAADELQKLRNFVEVERRIANSTPAHAEDVLSAQHREDYVAGLPAGSAALLGGQHLANFVEYRERRSIYLVYPRGLTEEQCRRSPEVVLCEEFLAEFDRARRP
jgi:hypothetical protein